jgi:hypothetical protein
MVKYSELDWETVREEVSNMADPEYRGVEQRQRIIAWDRLGRPVLSISPHPVRHVGRA